MPEQITNINADQEGMAVTMLVQIDRYLRATRMAETRFGRLAVNDPRLVRDLRNGREPGNRMTARIEAFIATGAPR